MNDSRYVFLNHLDSVVVREEIFGNKLIGDDQDVLNLIASLPVKLSNILGANQLLEELLTPFRQVWHFGEIAFHQSEYFHWLEFFAKFCEKWSIICHFNVGGRLSSNLLLLNGLWLSFLL